MRYAAYLSLENAPALYGPFDQSGFRYAVFDNVVPAKRGGLNRSISARCVAYCLSWHKDVDKQERCADPGEPKVIGALI
jgi:hypothetical protein